MKAKELFLKAQDDIGLQNLIESQTKYDDLKNHTIPEVRAILGNVAQTIDGLYDLCNEQGLTKNDTAQVVKEAFPTMDKNDRNKMRDYWKYFDEITAHFNGINSTSVSVDYMVKTWKKFVSEQTKPTESKNAELYYLLKNKRDVKASRSKSNKTVVSSKGVSPQDHLLNLGKVLYNILKHGKGGNYLNSEIDKTITGIMDFAENFEKCKTELKIAVNQ